MNLFKYELPPEGESFETLHKRGTLKIVRIVSTSIDEPKEFCDKWEEWVVLLQGEAKLSMSGQEIVLKAGDTLYIPANTPHTLTSVTRGALWLAVHYDPKRCG